jgi:hypothetical protein
MRPRHPQESLHHKNKHRILNGRTTDDAASAAMENRTGRLYPHHHPHHQHRK